MIFTIDSLSKEDAAADEETMAQEVEEEGGQSLRKDLKTTSVQWSETLLLISWRFRNRMRSWRVLGLSLSIVVWVNNIKL